MPKFSIAKSTVVAMPREQVHDFVRNFREWPSWSPWLVAEPECELRYADDGSGYSWDGKIIGSGEIEVTEERRPETIHYRLAFLKPWKSESAVSFSFADADGGTRVTWTMDGSLPFFLFWMKSMMTAYIGMDYERGLAMLEDRLETGSVPSKLEFPGRGRFPGASYVGVERECPIAEIGERMPKDLESLASWMEKGGHQPAGKPLSSYGKWNPVRGITRYTIAVPVARPPSELPREFVSGDVPACDVYRIRHTGAYRHLANAWAAGMMRARNKVFRMNKRIAPFEIYEQEAACGDDGDCVTVVHFPVK